MSETVAAPSDVRGRISRQRVNILLGVTSEKEGTPQRQMSQPRPLHKSLLDKSRRELLEQAVRFAQQPSDCVRTGLALSELLVEQKESVRAFQNVLELVRTTADEPVALEPQLSTTASVLFRERLSGWWRSMSKADREKTVEAAGRLIESDATSGNQPALVRLADVLDLRAAGSATESITGLAARLDLLLGKRSLDAGDYETGIYYLERAADRLPRSDIALEALARLAVAYARPGEGLAAAPREAARALALLESFDSKHVMPPGLGNLVVPEPIRTTGDLTAQVRKMLPKVIFDSYQPMPRVLRDSSRLTLFTDTTVPAGLLPDVMSFHDPARPFDVFDQTVPLYMARQFRGLRYSASIPDRYFWTTDVDAPVESISWLAEHSAFDLAMQPAAIVNRVALLSARHMMCIIGLVSGQMLGPPLTTIPDDEALPDPPCLAPAGSSFSPGFFQPCWNPTERRRRPVLAATIRRISSWETRLRRRQHRCH
jgi:hypothetical protein